MNKVFMDFMEDDNHNDEEFDYNTFINSFGNIDNMSSFDVLGKISGYEISDRKKIFANSKIRNKLKYGLLDESKDNQWYYYRKILNKITPYEFISLYTASELNEFFDDSEYGSISIFYSVLCEKDINNTVRYILKDDEMFKSFINDLDNYSLYFSNLDYNLFKDFLIKIQSNKLYNKNYYLSYISLDFQNRIISDPDINDDTLVFMLPLFNISTINKFFLNNPKVNYLFTRFNIVNLVKKGIKFNDNILKKREFFNQLKSDSFIVFRSNINNIEKYNNPIIIEERLSEYYDELINCYDIKNNLFKEYSYILNNPSKYEFNNLYIFSYDIVSRISSHLKLDDNGIYYYDDKEELELFLKDETNKKLSEVIIDALFRDNIYNVWINIKEMIRYNDILDKEKILDNDKIDFYKMILNFDKVNNADKINLFSRLKDKSINLIFYNDLRKLKDRAYDKIKEKIINPSLFPEYLDSENTSKYDVDIYDFRDKEYTMLVRTQDEYREIDHYRRGCYSIISNVNNQVFGEHDNKAFLYGYNSFDNDMVLHMFESDSYSSNFKEEGSKYVNRIMTADELVSSNSGYSEIQLINKKSDIRKYRWNAKKPDYLVTFECVRDKCIKESKRLGIPIVIISKRRLDKDKNKYDIEVNKYVDDANSEKEQRLRR